VLSHPHHPAALPAALRREQIQQLVAERGFVRVAEVRDAFSISSVTVRADFDALVAAGSLRRVHGGAVPVQQLAHGVSPSASAIPREREISLEESLAASVAPKQQIAAVAAGLVRSGQSVILDVGSTTLAIARALIARTELQDVVIITNGLRIALELESAIPRFSVIVTGGSLRALQHSLVEPLAATVFAQVHADLAFIGCNGVDVQGGVTNINLPEAGVKTMMIAAAERAIVVADGSKLGRVHLGRVGPLAAFATLITDAQADPAALLALADAGLRALMPASVEQPAGVEQPVTTPVG